MMIKEIWLPYMKQYTVCDKDTWTSIAENICGDAQAVSLFLRDDNVRYLRVPEGLPSAAPRVGESLIIPIKSDEKAKVLAKGKELEKALAEGGNWDKLAAEYSNQALPGVFTPDLKNISAGLASAIESLKAEQNSALLETSSGVHLFRMMSVETTRTASYAEVKDSITLPPEKLAEMEEKARTETLDALRKQYPVKIREDYLRRVDFQEPPDPLPVDAVLAEADGLKFTIEDLLANLAPQQKTWRQVTPDQRKDIILNSEKVVGWMILRDVVAKGYDTNDEGRGILEDSANEALSVLSYLRMQGHYATPNEGDLRKYWEDNPLKFTQPEKVKLHEITKRIDLTASEAEKKVQIEKATRELQTLRPQLTDLAKFETVARNQSQAISTRSRGGNLGSRLADFRGEDFRSEIAKLEVGAVSEPFVSGNDVLLIRLDDRETSGPEPFDRCQTRVLEEWRKDKAKTIEDDFRAILFKEYAVEVKIQ